MAFYFFERLHERSWSYVWLFCALVGYGGLAVKAVQAQAGGVMLGQTTIEIASIDSQATGYATFQSHNQKIVANRNGIFTARLYSIGGCRAVTQDGYIIGTFTDSATLESGDHSEVFFYKIRAGLGAPD